MIAYLILAALGIYFILNIETIAILNYRVRYFRFQDELYEINEFLYVGIIIFIVLMLGLALREMNDKYKDNKK